MSLCGKHPDSKPNMNSYCKETRNDHTSTADNPYGTLINTPWLLIDPPRMTLIGFVCEFVSAAQKKKEKRKVKPLTRFGFPQRSWESVKLSTNCSQPNKWAQVLLQETDPMEDRITDYQGKESGVASGDLLRNQKIWHRVGISLNQNCVCLRWKLERNMQEGCHHCGCTFSCTTSVEHIQSSQWQCSPLLVLASWDKCLIVCSYFLSSSIETQ